MLNTYKIYDTIFVASDTHDIVIIEQNVNENWDVFVPITDNYIANATDIGAIRLVRELRDNVARSLRCQARDLVS